MRTDSTAPCRRYGTTSAADGGASSSASRRRFVRMSSASSRPADTHCASELASADPCTPQPRPLVFLFLYFFCLCGGGREEDVSEAML